jgi:CheY-like chemotaxis protein
MAPRAPALPSGSPTLLVIDDEPAITTLVKRIAEPYGYRVFATSDPDQFKQRCLAGPPDLICLDVAMPRVDGIELMQFLAGQQCRSRLLIMSGSDPQLLHSALSLGDALGLEVLGTLAKPLRIEELRAVLEGLRPLFIRGGSA